MEGILGELIGLTAVVLIFGSIPACIVAYFFFKSRTRMQMQQTLRAAIEKGQTLTPDMVDTIARDIRPAPSPVRDLRIGVVWLGIAAGFVAVAYVAAYGDAPGAFWPFIGLSCIPGFIGVAYLVNALLSLSQKKA
jgi:hypothetical protein